MFSILKDKKLGEPKIGEILNYGQIKVKVLKVKNSIYHYVNDVEKYKILVEKYNGV